MSSGHREQRMNGILVAHGAIGQGKIFCENALSIVCGLVLLKLHLKFTSVQSRK